MRGRGTTGQNGGWALAAVIFLLFLMLAAPLRAEDAALLPTPEALADITLRAEGAIRAGTVETKTLEALRHDLAQMRDSLADAAARGDVAVRALAAEQAELPPAPAKDATEPARIATERTRLADALAEADAPLLAQRQSLARLKVLIADIDGQLRARQRAEVLTRGPTPLLPGTWSRGLAQIGTVVGQEVSDLAESAAIPSRQAAMARGRIVAALLLPLSILGWIGAARGLARFERHETRGGAPGAARVALAILARGLVTLGFALLIVFALAQPFRWPGHEPELAPELLTAAVLITAANWLAHLIFAPAAGHRRIVALPAAAARRATRLCEGLGLVVALEMMSEASLTLTRIGDAGQALVALAIMALAAPLLWQLGSVLGALAGSELRVVLARLLKVLAIAILAAVILGYSALARALLDPLLVSLWLIGLTVALHRLVMGMLTRLGRIVRPRFETATETVPEADGARRKLVSIAVAAGLVLASAPLHALTWGARSADLRDGFLMARSGVDLGGVRLSLTGVAVVIGTFALGLILTRWVQKLLREEVLPNTRLDRGGQIAIVTGFGYGGVILSALVAVTAAGINLASLAIVAGALSVGLGFGLQAIVSNFVSGVILLVERPIKEGDLIQVAGNMGFVRKISVRATRIETPDGHDLIVPNADLITGLVRNMTLSSASGRIELPVGVAYGTDLTRACAVLTELARAHPEVVSYPAPVVLMTGTADSSLTLELRVFVRDIARGVFVKSELYLKMVPALSAAGIEIPFPVRDLRLPEGVTLPTGPA
ncbi:small-conductance mechanosensitive channel [Rhodobacter viridis]|uniref:Small-conductance mechanosensitive channel n=1 Tax=Rhodobacter viridis TaxID=1054202 RepID=A0A318TWD1_9RHOB|nr:small-conductance mechanosensitive channel [Rhodobacter viridis]